MRDAYLVRKYSLQPPASIRKRAVADSERRRIELAVLEQFECPRCGETEPPHLDLFDLDARIDCAGCDLPGALRDFLK